MGMVKKTKNPKMAKNRRCQRIEDATNSAARAKCYSVMGERMDGMQNETFERFDLRFAHEIRG
jgi:hypothetical protein